MPSRSLIRWNGERAEALDEIENAHAIVGGTERGRRFATQQINYSYTALLSSHFQGFCRDLHSECMDRLVAIVPVHLQDLLRAEFTWNRSLARGNPHPGAIGSDFHRLGVDIWIDVYALDARNERRRELLQELIDWRNAIAHQDFDPVAPGGVPTLHLARVRAWRSAMNALARSFDQAMYNYLQGVIGIAPWRCVYGERIMAEIKFRKGDRVRFRFVLRFVEGVVKEDRGPIGINGRHLYLVEFHFGPYAESDSHIELPAEKLQLVSEPIEKE